MNQKNNTQCPTSHEFELYLSGKGNVTFNQRFEVHLTNCPLCAEAVEGYQKISASPIDIKARNPYRGKVIKWQSAASIAASIALVMSVTFAALNYTQNRESQKVLAFTDTETDLFVAGIKSQGPKKLAENSQSGYWYIGDQNHVEINDRRINSTELEAALKQSKSNGEIMVQVETTDYTKASEIINRLKNESGALVFTFSKSQGIK